jgi:hypothetical protein
MDPDTLPPPLNLAEAIAAIPLASYRRLESFDEPVGYRIVQNRLHEFAHALIALDDRLGTTRPITVRYHLSPEGYAELYRSVVDRGHASPADMTSRPLAWNGRETLVDAFLEGNTVEMSIDGLVFRRDQLNPDEMIHRLRVLDAYRKR